MEHTKGPWEARGKMVSSGKDCVGGESICQCYDNGMANARLIAAAPELLEALKRIEKALRQESGPEKKGTTEMCELIQDVTKQAIARAEGTI